MKKGTLFFCFLLLSILAISQPVTGSFGSPTTAIRIYTLVADSGFTLPQTRTFLPSRIGSLRFNLIDSSVQVWNGALWRTLGSGGGGGTTYTFSSPLSLNAGTGAVSINNAAADGTTKGAATFNASDFNATNGVVSIDYANGQAASASTKGFLTTTDWARLNTALQTETDPKRVVSGAFTGTTTKSLTLTLADATTVAAGSFTDLNTGGGGSSFDTSFNATTPSTSPIPGLTGVTLGTTDIRATLYALIYPTQAPNAGLTVTYSGNTAGTINLEQMSSGAALPVTLNWSAGRQSNTATISTIAVNFVNQSFSQPAAGGSVNGTKSENVTRNTPTSFTNVVTTSDGKSSSSTAYFNFYYKRYYGFVNSNTPTDANIQGLTNEFITSRTRATTSDLSPTGSQYFVVAFPESFDVGNTSQMWIGGLDQTASFTRSTRSFTNASGATTNYIIYVTQNTQSGAIGFEIK